jgi:hypothetical protein
MPVIINGSTGISGTDGTAATPVVQGTDANTGMWFPAADEIAFSEGGVEALRLNASGNAVFTGTVRVGGIAADLYPLVLGTAQASTSGTNIDFTGIPSWAKRITVMFNGVSTNGSSLHLVRLGISSGIVSSGYIGASGNRAGEAANTTGFLPWWNGVPTAALAWSGSMVITNITGNVWNQTTLMSATSTPTVGFGSGVVSLADVLDRVRITTVNGTDLFDAGSINVMWEG